jgi:hypothetical protein
MRQQFARFLQEGTDDGFTNGEHIIRTLIQMAKEGDMRAIEYVLDRMGGKPLQAVEVGTEYSFNFLSDAERIRITESVKKIKQMQAAEGAAGHPVGRTLTVLPSASEFGPKVTVPPGENAKNVPSKPKGGAPPGEALASNSMFTGDPDPLSRRSAEMRPCRHGIFHHQCFICGALGW